MAASIASARSARDRLRARGSRWSMARYRSGLMSKSIAVFGAGRARQFEAAQLAFASRADGEFACGAREIRVAWRANTR